MFLFEAYPWYFGVFKRFTIRILMNRPCIASVDFRRDEAYVDKINVEATVQAETNVAGHPNERKV